MPRTPRITGVQPAGRRRRGDAAAGDERIFVMIPAYRDRELAPTLRSLFATARAPERLRVVVLWQRGPRETLPRDVRSLPNLELLAVPHTASRGCNWARARLQRQWRGEPFTLLLDSHHRFCAGWDVTTLAMYRSLVARGVRRPLLTAYLPQYTPAMTPAEYGKAPMKIYPLEWQAGMLLRLTSYPIPFWRTVREPVPADFVSLHFVFTDGAFHRDVPFDPHTYFVGDEVAMSVRAFTHGFELFHPHRVLGWHCYDRGSRVTHWTDHAEWREQNERSLRRLRRLFAGRVQGRHGIGGERSVADYEERGQLDLLRAVP